MGITEESDALAVIVSEETGGIALAVGGEIIEGLNAQTLRDHLEEELASQMEEKKSTPALVAREAGDA
ncbi:MAG: hypothetical protein GTN89_04980 [Acidobacteria bacterium]|nr:hypothetical protein [Acidobacteriota bacterium]NIM62260.1 hypothetical protein [Acidobacteriota bacterium]NIO58666.1 hypothetical protein [Acidobacteriota bacterium]NIQ29722.1 hypothetical protein [Acidobacteriota bacterium]NIQ84446.1 hypothetical protein [Acidobacteriota bacterium]